MQQIVEIVRDASRQLPQRLHLLRLNKLFACFFDYSLRLMPGIAFRFPLGNDARAQRKAGQCNADHEEQHQEK